MTDEEVRLAAPQGGDGAVKAAWQDREARLAADEAQLRAGPIEHGREQLSFHTGQPTVEVQQKTHGASAPRLPDVGGHG